MSENVRVPKMINGDSKKRRKISISFFNLLILFIGVLALIMSTFVAIPIKHYVIPWGIFTGKSLTLNDFIYCYTLIPQIPFLMFLYSVLRKRLTILVVFIYILLGLFFIPVFALGGGIKYFGQYGFGYILAYIPAIIIANNFNKIENTILKYLVISVVGVLSIHIIGILYMMFVALFRHAGWQFVGAWIGSQSGIKVFYDIVGSYILMLIGHYLYLGLKFLNK